MRRLTTLLIPAALLVAVAAPAQAPPDERAAARAFADAGLRFHAALAPLEPRYQEISRTPPPRCVRRFARRFREPRAVRILLLPLASYYGEIGRLFAPALTTFSMNLHGIQTDDPALRAGRTAWRRMRQVFAELAAIPPVDICAEARRYIRGGFERTPAITHGLRLRALMRRDPVDDFNRRVARAGHRLRELGIPPEEAEAFERDPDDGFETR
jgi:hypothetical protein